MSRLQVEFSGRLWNLEEVKNHFIPMTYSASWTSLELRGIDVVERVEGIEPSTKAWEAFVLPLNYTRSERLTLYQMCAAI